MRTIRTLMTALVLGAMLPSLAAAQRDRDFKDAWFWGLKLGGMSIPDSGGGWTQAPTVGADWMITRTHGGVYIAASETFFTQHRFMLVDPTTADSGFRPVKLKNLRHIEVLGVGFPGEYHRWHPYIAAGFGASEIGSTTAEGVFSSTDQLLFAQQIIDEGKVAFSPVIMGGAQYRLRYFSMFGQVALVPGQRNFLLSNGNSVNFTYEVGFRYNIGSSIEKDY